MRQISVRALRAHFVGAAGVFLTMVLAAVLVSAAGTLMESGWRAQDRYSATAMLLPAMMASFGGVAVMIAVFVVSTAFAAALRDRRREFALLRAVGATGAQVRTLVSTEVMLISAAGVFIGGVLGIGAARALVPLLVTSGIVEDGFEPVVSPLPVLAAALLLLPAAWLSGLLAAREMARLSPAAAVGSSTAEVKPLSKGRIPAASICAIGGAIATLSPLLVPGAMGGAAGAASALLFIAALALAGPALVLRTATWLSTHSTTRRGAPLQLATVNARGYSRRLTAAVVPLALLVALGTIQTGMSKIVATAASQQLGDALTGELLWVGSASDAGRARSVLDALPGVQRTATTSVSLAHTKIEGDASGGGAAGVEWEPVTVRVVDDPSGDVIDPLVTGGTLADLRDTTTVAVAADALMLTGKGVGDTIGVQFADVTRAQPKIVAVFDRGLGLGSVIMGPGGLGTAAMPDAPVTIVVDASEAAVAEVRSAATAEGVELTTTEVYLAETAAGGADSNRLSDTLLIALLAFIAIAAGNSLVIATRARRGEFVLLGKLGATRSQLRVMLAIEAGLVAIGAVVLGALMALPGLTAATIALVRGFSLGVDVSVFGGLALAATLVACIGFMTARLRPAT